MPVKRLRWYHKMMGALGKRMFYSKAQKLNLMATTLMVRYTIEEYKDITGSYENGIKEFEKVCEIGTWEIISEMMEQKIAFGIGLYDIISLYLPDSAWAIPLGFYSLAGGDFMKHIFDDAVFIPAISSPDGNPRIIVRFKKCMMCAGISDEKREELKGVCYGGYFGVLLASATGVMSDEVEWGYDIQGSETKCYLKGDDHPEFILKFTPKPEKKEE